MSCFVQYAPYHLVPDASAARPAAATDANAAMPDGNGAAPPQSPHPWDLERDAFGETVIDAIAQFAPNIRNCIIDRQVLTPLDLEREFGLSEGNIFQGELTLEQLFFLRPAAGWADYRTPIRRLYMCGSATHPGGGIMGAPGRNAAMKLLADVRA
jgi:phytoene dehydrogenase-like protein